LKNLLNTAPLQCPEVAFLRPVGRHHHLFIYLFIIIIIIIIYC